MAARVGRALKVLFSCRNQVGMGLPISAQCSLLGDPKVTRPRGKAPLSAPSFPLFSWSLPSSPLPWPSLTQLLKRCFSQTSSSYPHPSPTTAVNSQLSSTQLPGLAPEGTAPVHPSSLSSDFLPSGTFYSGHSAQLTHHFPSSRSWVLGTDSQHQVLPLGPPPPEGAACPLGSGWALLPCHPQTPAALNVPALPSEHRLCAHQGWSSGVPCPGCCVVGGAPSLRFNWVPAQKGETEALTWQVREESGRPGGSHLLDHAGEVGLRDTL